MMGIASRSCVVHVQNVLMEIQRYNGNHYVRNTNIQVPFYKSFLDSLRNNRPLLNALYVANGVRKESFNDHNYCRRVHEGVSPASRKRTRKSKPAIYLKRGYKKVRKQEPSKSSNKRKKETKKSRHPVLDLDVNSLQTFSNSKRLQKKAPARSKILVESSSNWRSRKTTPSFIIDFTDKSAPWRKTVETDHRTYDLRPISELSSVNRHHQLLSKTSNFVNINEVRQERSRYPDWRLCYLEQRNASIPQPLADDKE